MMLLHKRKENEIQIQLRWAGLALGRWEIIWIDGPGWEMSH
jgi:hypothetical protein